MPSWSKIRSSYPALKNYIYLDTAGTGIVSNSTARAAKQFYTDLNQHGNCKLESSIERMQEARRNVAELIGARPEEVAFVPNTSHGMNIAAMMLKGQGVAVANDSEFPSSTIAWINQGYKMNYVRSRKNVVHLEDIEKAIGRRRKGIIISSYVQYCTGFRQDMVELGRLARKKGHYFVANITQGCGAFPVNVKKWGVDFACCTGIKWLCAGEGAGFLYIRRELLKKLPVPLAGWFSVKNPMKMDNRCTNLKDTTSRFEVGGPAFPNIFALGNATKEILRLGVENITERIYSLTDYLLGKLKAERIAVASPLDFDSRSGIILVKTANANMIVEVLRARGIRVSARGPGIRVSMHFYNNRDDLNRLVYHLKKLL